MLGLRGVRHMKIVSIAALAILGLGALPASAQPIISAKSGTISDVMGKVYLGNQLIEPSLTRFPDVKENAVLRTTEGRAEVLLPPGVFFRLGESGSFRMITNRLIDTRLELLTGSAILEADQIVKDTNVTVVAGNAAVTFSKAGLYRFDMQPPRLKVFKGFADVEIGGRNIAVSTGRRLDLDGAASVQKFDTEDTDALDNWNQRRSEYVAQANVSAANYARQNGLALMDNSWMWNPYLGMYTFLPCTGLMYSPYGYMFWSPVTVGRIYYNPPPVLQTGRFGRPAGAPGTPSGYSGTLGSRSSGMAATRSGSPGPMPSGAASMGRGGAGGHR